MKKKTLCTRVGAWGGIRTHGLFTAQKISSLRSFDHLSTQAYGCNLVLIQKKPRGGGNRFFLARTGVEPVSDGNEPSMLPLQHRAINRRFKTSPRGQKNKSFIILLI